MRLVHKNTSCLPVTVIILLTCTLYFVSVKLENISINYLFENQEIANNDYLITLTNLLCNFNTKLLFIYYEQNVSIEFINHLIEGCSNIKGNDWHHKSYSTLVVVKFNMHNVTSIEILPQRNNLQYIVTILREPNANLINHKHLTQKLPQTHLLHYLTIYEENVIESPMDGDGSALLSEFFWKLNILNSILIFYDNNTKCMSYFPFQNKTIDLVHDDLLFPNKLKSFEGHNFRVSYFPDEHRGVLTSDHLTSGPDALLWRTIATFLNSTISFKLPPNGVSYGDIIAKDNVTGEPIVTGSLGHIMRHDVDSALNTKFLRYFMINRGQCETTYPFYRNDFCILLPIASSPDEPPKEFQMFNVFIILCNLCTWLMLVIISKIMLRYEIANSRDYNKTRRNKFWFYYIQSHLNGAAPKFPLQNSEKILLFSWIIYSMIYNIYLNSFMFSKFTFVQHIQRIETIAELNEAGAIAVVATGFDAEVLVGYYLDAGIHHSFVDKLAGVDEDVFWEMISTKNVTNGYAASFFYLTNVASNQLDANGRPLFYIMNECPIQLMNTYHIPYGSPYLNVINKCVMYIFEAGLSQLWESNLAASSLKTEVNKYNQPENLLMENFQQFCKILLCGHFLAFIVFCGEYVHFNFEKILKIVRSYH